jgi:hypothetical protein
MIASNIGTWNKVEESKTMQQLAKGAGAVGNAIAGDIGKAIAGYLGKEAKDIYEGASAINQAYLELTNPGVSKESVKAFAPSEIGDTLTTSFYLFNTQKQQDIQDNWNFLWTLTYQNLPNRKSINLMDPPCIYSVEVPGFKRFPWAVITGLKVQNVGTTRLIDITTGEIASVAQAANNTNIKIIPEVYKVTITIQSLFMNSRNLFYYMKDGNISTKINVKDDFNGNLTGTASQVDQAEKNTGRDRGYTSIIGGSFIGSGPSDYNLKENIVFLNKQHGLNIYSYNYIWNKQKKYTGVIAQDLLNTVYSNAVSVFEKGPLQGYYSVNYNMLPVGLKKII